MARSSIVGLRNSSGEYPFDYRKYLETPRLIRDKNILENNRKLICAFIDEINRTATFDVEKLFWRGVDKNLVANLVNDFKVNPWHFQFQGSAIGKYIREMPGDKTWDVLIVTGDVVYAIDVKPEQRVADISDVLFAIGIGLPDTGEEVRTVDYVINVVENDKMINELDDEVKSHLQETGVGLSAGFAEKIVALLIDAVLDTDLIEDIEPSLPIYELVEHIRNTVRDNPKYRFILLTNARRSLTLNELKEFPFDRFSDHQRRSNDGISVECRLQRRRVGRKYFRPDEIDADRRYVERTARGADPKNFSNVEQSKQDRSCDERSSSKPILRGSE